MDHFHREGEMREWREWGGGDEMEYTQNTQYYQPKNCNQNWNLLFP